jgi:hypothetical protein
VRLSFTPTSNQSRIVVFATNITNPGAYLNLVTPPGSTSPIATVEISNYPTGFTYFIDTQTVVPGTAYELWVQHIGTLDGSETLQIAKVPADLSHNVTIGGAAYQFSTVAGQNANITFNNPSSQSVTVQWTNGTYAIVPPQNNTGCYLTVTGPSPSTNQVGAGACTASTGSIGLGTIPQGTYNILVNPQLQQTGGMSLTVTTP